MRLIVIHHPYDRPRFEQDFVDRLSERPEITVAAADLAALAGGRLAGDGAFAGFDAVAVFVAFNRLRSAPALDWQGFSGRRVLIDHDAIQNYSDIAGDTYAGAWPPAFRRHKFDLLVTSGRAVRDRLEAEGIRAAWLPKGFERTRFSDTPGPRAGLTSYGSAYACRKVSERALREAGIAVERIDTVLYPQLPAELSRYLACLAVSSDLETPHAARGELAQIAARRIAMRPGLEPMAKVFEAAGAGCCPVADAMPDLAALGFRDGENAVLFRSHDELVEKIGWWMQRPDALRALGSAAARHVRDGHSWAHRAAALPALIAV